MQGVNTKKSGGGDWVFPNILERQEHRSVIAHRIHQVITSMEDGGNIPSFWKKGRMVLLSKNGSDEAKLEETRPIVVSSTALNIAEKTIYDKSEETDLL